MKRDPFIDELNRDYTKFKWFCLTLGLLATFLLGMHFAC